MANYFTLSVIAVVYAIFIHGSSFSESTNLPFLVAHKRVSRSKLNPDLERLSVSIDIYNAGSDAAFDVTLTDDNWAEEVFDTVIGNTSKTWEKLDSGSLVSHSFELESKVKTVYYGTPALITYRVPTKSNLQEAYSTPILPLTILSDTPADKKIEIAKMILNVFELVHDCKWNVLSSLFLGLECVGIFAASIRLLVKYSSHVSVVLIVILFANIITSPAKSGAGKKRR